MEKKGGSKSILLIEDSDEDYQTLLWTFKKLTAPYPVFRCSNGDEALDFLSRRGKFSNLVSVPLPSLVILDLNLPGKDGRDILRRIKQDLSLKFIPLVVLTTTSNPKDIKTCYLDGANTYILKPVDLGKFKRSIQQLLDYWFEAAILPDS